MIDVATARACITALATEHGTHLIEPGDSRIELTTAIMEGVVKLVPGGEPLLRQLQELLQSANETVSVTVPSPLGTLIIFSKAAVQTGPDFTGTGMHELVHDGQISKVGPLQAGIDYLGSGELKALREAEGSGVGLWAKAVVTGVLPDPEDASVLRSSIYHLDPPDKQFARAVVESVLGAVRTGATPPFSVARRMLKWLRANAPEAIMLADYR